HRSGKLVRDTVAAAIDTGGVGVDHAPARIYQAFDHRVGVFGCVRGLRGVGSRGDALADFAEACDQLGDVTVLRVVRRTTEVPDHIVRIRRIGDAPGGPDVLNNRTVALLRPRALEQAIGDDAALQGFVLVMVRVDEARHDDCPGAVDDFGAAGGDRWR